LFRALSSTSSVSSSDTNIHSIEYLYEDCSIDTSIGSMALLIAAIIFLIFCCAMSCEQIDAITTGQGKIARMKMSVGNYGTEFSPITQEVNEMFGGSNPHIALHWFLPWIPVNYPHGLEKVVQGYECDPHFATIMEPYRETNKSSQASFRTNSSFNQHHGINSSIENDEGNNENKVTDTMEAGLSATSPVLQYRNFGPEEEGIMMTPIDSHTSLSSLTTISSSNHRRRSKNTNKTAAATTTTTTTTKPSNGSGAPHRRAPSNQGSNNQSQLHDRVVATEDLSSSSNSTLDNGFGDTQLLRLI
jgi:hypothetical protein